MTLPRPPISLNTPIPNQPFSTEEVYYLEGNQGHLPLGQGLYIDPATGQFTNIEPSPYIYCTPQYSNLPPTEPPYGCNTEVNTAGVTDFTEAWYNCQYLTEFPCVDSGSVTNFTSAWRNCYSLTSFPPIDTSAGQNFTYSWNNCFDIVSFPLLNVSSGLNFSGAWYSCTSLTSFPLLDVSSGENFTNAWSDCPGLTSFPVLDTSSGVNFAGAWSDCTSLVSFPKLNVNTGVQFGGCWSFCTNLSTFPAGMFDNCSATTFYYAWKGCALSQQSVDNILVSLDTAGQSNGIVNIDGGTSAAPGATGLAAKASLQGKGWTVLTN